MTGNLKGNLQMTKILKWLKARDINRYRVEFEATIIESGERRLFTMECVGLCPNDAKKSWEKDFKDDKRLTDMKIKAILLICEGWDY